MATVNLPFPVAPAQPLIGPQGQPFTAIATDIQRRDDLLPTCIAIKFRIISTVNGAQQESVINDIATTISGTVVEGIGYDGGLVAAANWISSPTDYLASGTQTALQNAALAPEVKANTVQMDGGDQDLCVINTLAVSTADPAVSATALAMWQFLRPDLKTATGLTLYSGTGATGVTAVDDNGNSLDLTKYAYILLDNAIPSWLNGQNPNPGLPLVVQATISAQLVYNEFATLPGGSAVPTKVKPYDERGARATLIQIGGGAYAAYTGSEVVPYGLAGYIYNIESVVQFEGVYTIQENEITDICPIGSALNLTGTNAATNAEWSVMGAQVQTVRYNIMAGTTQICFGPAVHLGAKDMVELNRCNRGPRLFYLIGGNLANQPNSGSSSPTNNAQRSATLGTEQNSQEITHKNLADSQANASSYAYGFPGFSYDQRTSGQPNYGQGSGVPSGLAPIGPTIHLQDGGSGTYGGCVRISTSDVGGAAVYIQEMPVQYDFGDGSGCVSAFALILCSKPYHTSGHPTGG